MLRFGDAVKKLKLIKSSIYLRQFVRKKLVLSGRSLNELEYKPTV